MDCATSHSSSSPFSVEDFEFNIDESTQLQQSNSAASASCLSWVGKSEILDRKISARPDKGSLIAQNVLKSTTISPTLHAQATALSRAQTVDSLRKGIHERPDSLLLMQGGILKETSVSPALQSQSEDLRRARVADFLNSAIKNRPGPLDLVHGNIIPMGQESCPLTPGSISEGGLSSNCGDMPPDLAMSFYPMNVSSPDVGYSSPMFSSVVETPDANQLGHNDTIMHYNFPPPNKKNEVLRRQSMEKGEKKKKKPLKFRYHHYQGPPVRKSSLSSSGTQVQYFKLLSQQQEYLSMQGSQGSSKNSVEGGVVEVEKISRSLHDFKIADLRTELKARGLPTTGKKKVLIERLYGGTAANFPEKKIEHDDRRRSRSLDSIYSAYELQFLQPPSANSAQVSIDTPQQESHHFRNHSFSESFRPSDASRHFVTVQEQPPPYSSKQTRDDFQHSPDMTPFMDNTINEHSGFNLKKTGGVSRDALAGLNSEHCTSVDDMTHIVENSMDLLNPARPLQTQTRGLMPTQLSLSMPSLPTMFVGGLSGCTTMQQGNDQQIPQDVDNNDLLDQFLLSTQEVEVDDTIHETLDNDLDNMIAPRNMQH